MDRSERIRAWCRLAFSFAEILVIVVLAGAAMLPVVGTLTVGRERTETWQHKNRMRVMCESYLTKAVASAAYLRVPVETVSSLSVPWPNSTTPLATYIVNVDLIETVSVGKLPYGPAGDFAVAPIVGSQPTHVRAVQVTIYLRNDIPASEGGATESVRMAMMLSLPRSSVADRIYFSTNEQEILAVDPGTRNVLERYPLPNTPYNIAVHPGGKHIAIQERFGVSVLEVDLESVNRGRVTQVWRVPGDAFPIVDTIVGAAGSRGIVFRQDGRQAFMSARGGGAQRTVVMRFEVPDDPRSASWSWVLATHAYPGPFAGQYESTDMVAGDDGFVYVGESGNTTNRVQRLDMVNPTGLTDVTTADAATLPTALAVSPDGRTLVTANLNTSFSAVSTENPASITLSAQLGPAQYDPIKGLAFSPDGRRIVCGNPKSAGNYRRISSFGMPPTITPGRYVPATAPTSLVVLSPDRQNFVVVQADAPKVWIDNIASLDANLLTNVNTWETVLSANPAARVVGAATRRAEEAVVVCADGVGTTGTVEVIDIYARERRADRSVPIPLMDDNTLKVIAMSPEGHRATCGYIPDNPHNVTLMDIDVLRGRVLGSVQCNHPGGVLWQRVVCRLRDGGTLVAWNDDEDDHCYYYVYQPNSSVPAWIEPLSTARNPVAACPLASGGALVLISNPGANTAELHWIGSDYQVWARWISSHDNFPPPGAVAMAISADDGLLAFYDPMALDGSADPDVISFYDFREMLRYQDRVQLYGLIHVNHPPDTTNFEFNKPTVYHFDGTATARQLQDALTRNSAWQQLAHYPGNIYTNVAGVYSQGNRFFGYFYPDRVVRKIGHNGADHLRIMLAGQLFQPVTWGGGENWRCEEHDIPDIESPQGLRFQHDYMTSDHIGATSIFTTSTASQGLPAPSGPAAGPYLTMTGWEICASPTFRPMRFAPSYLGEFETSTDIEGSDCSLVFSRDVASPTLFVLNREDSRLDIWFWGVGRRSYSLVASIPADSARHLAISPDNHRLLITGASPDKVYLVDISAPAAGTYGKVIGDVPLPAAPWALATRPFVRQNSKRDTYDPVATFPVGISLSGRQLADLTWGGIYALGGAKNQSIVATTTAWCFSPASNSLTQIGPRLPVNTKRHAVVAYDGALYSFLGASASLSVPRVSDVQMWNPRTDEVLCAPELIAQPGLIARWKFDETSGTSAADATGNGRTGTLTNFTAPACWVSGKHANALDFAGDNDYVTVADHESLRISSGFTIMAWIRPDAISSSRIVHKTTGADGTDGYWFSLVGNKMRFKGGSTTADSLTDLTTGVWAHCAVTYDGTTVNFYLNGALDGSSAAITSVPINGVQFRIGADGTGGNRFDGLMDELLLFSRPLEQEEIEAAMGAYAPIKVSKNDFDGTGEVGSTWTQAGHKISVSNWSSYGGHDLKGWRAFNTSLTTGSNYSSQWWYNGNPTIWLQYDFPADTVVSQYRTKSQVTYANRPKSIEFWASRTGTWTASGTDYFVLHSKSSIGDDSTWKNWFIPVPNEYRYYRVRITEKYGGSIGTDEIQFWNLGESKKSKYMTSFNAPAPHVISSTLPEQGGKESWKALDGSVSTFWEPSSGNAGALDIDFGSQVVVNRIRVRAQNINESVKNVEVMVATNSGDPWQPLSGPLVVAKNDDWQTFNFSNSNAHQCYRFDISTVWGGSILRLAEIDFWDSGAGGQPIIPTDLEVSPQQMADAMGRVCDDQLASQSRIDHAAAVTPYGIIVGGGINQGNVVVSGANVYWPHGIASITLPPFVPAEVTARMTAAATPKPYATDRSSRHDNNTEGWKAFDGKESTVWQSSGGPTQWVQFDVGSGVLALVDSLELRGVVGLSTSNPQAWQLRAATAIANFGNGSGTAANQYRVIAGGTAANVDDWQAFSSQNTEKFRFFRFVVTSNYGGADVRLAELRLYGKARASTIAQLTATMTANMTPSPFRASALSFEKKDEPFKAFNGKTDDHWKSAAGPVQWLQIDLGEAAAANILQLRNKDVHNENLQAFALWASNDTAWAVAGDDYEVLLSDTKTNDTQWQTYEFPNDTAFRYYRLRVTSNYGAGKVRVGEMRLFGQVHSIYNCWGISRDIPPLGPGAVTGHALVYHSDGRLYRVGGCTDTGETGFVVTAHWFNFGDNTWNAVTPPGTLLQRAKFGACSFGEEIFVFGGRNSGGTTQTAAAWNPGTNKVRQLTPVPAVTDAAGVQSNLGYGITAVPCGDAIYLIGGATDATTNGSRSILRYNP